MGVMEDNGQCEFRTASPNNSTVTLAISLTIAW